MNNKLSTEVAVKYDARRSEFNIGTQVDKRAPCIAPYNNMYFTVEGNVAPCWLLIGNFEKWSTTRSMKDIWFGEKFSTYRENLKNKIFDSKCSICKQKIENGVWPLALAYDSFAISDYPTLLELELSNQCNLECVMCDGRLSSGIRKNRDNLPPMKYAYDDTFIEQLKEFIPHLQELRFNGGEPFAQSCVLDICKIVSEIKPELKITIATNGTVYNKNVEKILKSCNIHLNISIDGITKETYENIRINGNFNTLMNNFKKFNEYCNINNRMLSIMVNPMRNNWQEMGQLLLFVIKHNVHIWYNTVHHPAHLALWNLPSSKLREIKESLDLELVSIKSTILENNHLGFSNYKKFENLVSNQIAGWIVKQEERERNNKINNLYE